MAFFILDQYFEGWSGEEGGGGREEITDLMYGREEFR
jgi:hypothetical protein